MKYPLRKTCRYSLVPLPGTAPRRCRRCPGGWPRRRRRDGRHGRRGRTNRTVARSRFLRRRPYPPTSAAAPRPHPCSTPPPRRLCRHRRTGVADVVAAACARTQSGRERRSDPRAPVTGAGASRTRIRISRQTCNLTWLIGLGSGWSAGHGLMLHCFIMII